MRTKVPHNVLTISEMTKRPNRINVEVIGVDDLILTDSIIKKLRASSSMFNKTTYVQILHNGVKYNVEKLTVREVAITRFRLSQPLPAQPSRAQ